MKSDFIALKRPQEGNAKIKLFLLSFIFFLVSHNATSQGYVSNVNTNPFDILEAHDSSIIHLGISSYSTINNKLFGHPFEYNGDYQLEFNTHDNPPKSIFKNVTAGISLTTLHCFFTKPLSSTVSNGPVNYKGLTYYTAPGIIGKTSFYYKKIVRFYNLKSYATVGLKGDIMMHSGYYSEGYFNSNENASASNIFKFPTGLFLKVNIRSLSLLIFNSRNEYWPITKNLQHYNSRRSSSYYLPLVYNTINYSISRVFNSEKLILQPYYQRTGFKGEDSNGHINTFGVDVALSRSRLNSKYSVATYIGSVILKKRIMNIVYCYQMNKVSFLISSAFMSEIYPSVNLTTLFSDTKEMYAVWTLGMQYSL